MAEPVVSCQQDAQKAPPTIVTEVSQPFSYLCSLCYLYSNMTTRKNAVEVVTITDASAKQDSEKPLTAVIIEVSSKILALLCLL